jgi:hypothetical protein
MNSQQLFAFYGKFAIISIITFFTPAVPLLLLVGGAILGDTVLGVWAAKKRGEKISSSKLWNMVPKMLLYQATVCFAFMLDVWLIGEFLIQLFSVELLMVKMVALSLIYIESVSMDENFESITGKNLFRSFREMITRAQKVKEL